MKHRCAACKQADEKYCPHNGLLLVYIKGVAVHIVSDNEQKARETADKMRVRWCGTPFHRKATDYAHADPR